MKQSLQKKSSLYPVSIQAHLLSLKNMLFFMLLKILRWPVYFFLSLLKIIKSTITITDLSLYISRMFLKHPSLVSIVCLWIWFSWGDWLINFFNLTSLSSILLNSWLWYFCYKMQSNGILLLFSMHFLTVFNHCYYFLCEAWFFLEINLCPWLQQQYFYKKVPAKLLNILNW